MQEPRNEKREPRTASNGTMTLSEVHEWVDDAIEDYEYKVKQAKSPERKRKDGRVLNLFKSMKKHLIPLSTD